MRAGNYEEAATGRPRDRMANLQPYRSVIGLQKWIKAGSWVLTFWDEDVTEGRGMVQKNRLSRDIMQFSG